MSSAASSTPIAERGYANPDVLVSTAWVEENLTNPTVKIIESDEDVLLYDTGHIPGAIKVDWVNDLNDPVTRDYIDSAELQALLRAKGVNQGDVIVLYGDKSNWWATYALWVFRLFGHTNAKIMDGGRKKWVDEGRDLNREKPTYAATDYKVPHDRDDKTERALREDVLKHVKSSGQLVDVRSPAEYSGEKLHMEGYPQEGALRGGHIPGARNIPWSRSTRRAPERPCERL